MRTRVESKFAFGSNGPTKTTLLHRKQNTKLPQCRHMMSKETMSKETADDWPVDFVFTWVDGEDPNHLNAKAAKLQQVSAVAPANKRNASKPTRHHSSSHEACRWRNTGEIYEAVASVLTYAPWCRRIFIVCGLDQDPHIPKETDTQGKIRVVQHATIFPENFSALPVFNSHAIEANIHNIPDLSERFVYMCDDMFLGAPVDKTFFFDARSGLPRIFLGMAYTPDNVRLQSRGLGRYPGWYAARMNNFALLNQTFGSKVRYDRLHQAHAMCRTNALDAWSHRNFARLLMKTSQSAFRSDHDLEPLGLFSWFAIENKRGIAVHGGVSHHQLRSKYIEITCTTNFRQVSSLLRSVRPTMYCLNDTMRTPTAQHLQQYNALLKKGLPHHVASSSSLRNPAVASSSLRNPPAASSSSISSLRNSSVASSSSTSSLRNLAVVSSSTRTRQVSSSSLRNPSASSNIFGRTAGAA